MLMSSSRDGINNEGDMVNHPPHYTSGSVEVIDLMEKGFGIEATINYCELNAFKYRMRAGKKNDILQDIEKAQWYENKRAELLSKKDKGFEYILTL